MRDSRLTPRIDAYLWGRMVWLVYALITENPQMSLARMEVKAGYSSEAHIHDNCHECLHVLSGEITEYIDDVPTILTAGETVFIPRGAAHYSQNTGTEMSVLIISYSEEIRDYTPVNPA